MYLYMKDKDRLALPVIDISLTLTVAICSQKTKRITRAFLFYINVHPLCLLTLSWSPFSMFTKKEFITIPKDTGSRMREVLCGLACQSD